MIRERFPMIEVLYLTIPNCTDRAFMNANKWEQLITFHLPQLRIFNLQCGFNAGKMSDLVNEFTTPFWTTRQWSFSYQPHARGGITESLIILNKPF